MQSATQLLCSIMRSILLLTCSVALVAGPEQPWGQLQPVPAKFIRGELTGIYAMFGELTQQFVLHVFPDGDVMLMNHTFSDAGEFVGSGTWTLNGDVVTVLWCDWRDTADGLRRPAKGSSEYMLHESRHENGQVQFFLVPGQLQTSHNRSHPLRMERYIDWQLKKTALVDKKK